MPTSAPDVYACGDAAEFAGRTWGLWPTAVRQAEIVAASLLGEDDRFVLSEPPTVLKGVGVSLVSSGRLEAGPGDEMLVHENAGAGTYSKLIVSDRHRLVGGLLYGYTREVPHLQRLIAAHADVDAVLPALRLGNIEALTDAVLLPSEP